jgi:hypothetical protein
VTCDCRSVADREGGSVVRHCEIHAAAPNLLRALMNLLHAIALLDDESIKEEGGKTPPEIYGICLNEARKLVKPLASLYYERPRGISGLPDAGPPGS